MLAEGGGCSSTGGAWWASTGPFLALRVLVPSLVAGRSAVVVVGSGGRTISGPR